MTEDFKRCTFRAGGGEQCMNEGIYWVKNIGKPFYPFIPGFLGKSCEQHKNQAEDTKEKEKLLKVKEVVLEFKRIL